MTSDAPIGEDDLQAYVDGRAAPARLPAVEAYLKDHPQIATRVEAERQQRDALRLRLAFKVEEPIPSRLRISSIKERKPKFRVGRPGAIAAAACWMMMGGIIGGAVTKLGGYPSPKASSAYVSDIRAASDAYRTFTVETLHPVEVKASAGAHLTQWLSNRVGRPLVSPDLTHLGFRLMGGRVLPSATGVAAQLMYDDDKGSRLTVYIKATSAAEASARVDKIGALVSVIWVDRGLGFVVTGAIPQNLLIDIAKAVSQQFGAKNILPDNIL